MIPTRLLLGILVAAATVKVSQGKIVRVFYDQSVNFTCDPSPPDLDLASLPPGDVLRMWILPDGELLQSSTTGHERVEVLQNGAMLHVRKVDDEDFGMYYCVVYVYSEQRYLTVRHGLNVDGAYWGNLTRKYSGMAITGVVAGAVCLVFASTFCFLYNRQQARLDSEAEEDKVKAMAAFVQQGEGEKPPAQSPSPAHYTNVAYVPDAEDASAKSDAQISLTQYTSIAYAEEVSPKKGQAPQPPASGAQAGHELQNVAAGVAVGATSGADKTKL